MRNSFGDVLKNPLVIGLLASHVAKNLVDSYGQAKQNAMMPDPTEQAFEKQALASGNLVTEMPNTGIFHKMFGVGSDMTQASPGAIAGEKIALRGRGMEDLDAAAKVATLAKSYGSGNTDAMMQGQFGAGLRNAGINVPTNLPYATPQEDMIAWKDQVNQRIIDQNKAMNDIRQQQVDNQGRMYDARISKLESGDGSGYKDSAMARANFMTFARTKNPMGVPDPVLAQMSGMVGPGGLMSMQEMGMEYERIKAAQEAEKNKPGLFGNAWNAIFGGGPTSATASPAGDSSGGWYPTSPATGTPSGGVKDAW